MARILFVRLCYSHWSGLLQDTCYTGTLTFEVSFSLTFVVKSDSDFISLDIGHMVLSIVLILFKMGGAGLTF